MWPDPSPTGITTGGHSGKEGPKDRGPPPPQHRCPQSKPCHLWLGLQQSLLALVWHSCSLPATGAITGESKSEHLILVLKTTHGLTAGRRPESLQRPAGPWGMQACTAPDTPAHPAWLLGASRGTPSTRLPLGAGPSPGLISGPLSAQLGLLFFSMKGCETHVLSPSEMQAFLRLFVQSLSGKFCFSRHL